MDTRPNVTSPTNPVAAAAKRARKFTPIVRPIAGVAAYVDLSIAGEVRRQVRFFTAIGNSVTPAHVRAAARQVRLDRAAGRA